MTKHKSSRRILALIMALVLALSLAPVISLADDGEITFWDVNNTNNVTAEELTVTVDGETMNITRYTGHYFDENEENQIVYGATPTA
ncbi:MAG: hypothetical protein LUC19_01470 [Oscillospiraceae bacterium]|nr:hypothetical protein [Oscillospiraceae bacterium]MCD8374062.1 hypothetical protein [Oscillospiraceae bacterium]